MKDALISKATNVFRSNNSQWVQWQTLARYHFLDRSAYCIKAECYLPGRVSGVRRVPDFVSQPTGIRVGGVVPLQYQFCLNGLDV